MRLLSSLRFRWDKLGNVTMTEFYKNGKLVSDRILETR
jgi:hypothetical protein